MTVAAVIQRPRHRMLWHEIVAQSAFAVSIPLGAIILLLLLDAEIPDGRWLIALLVSAVAGGACGAFRVFSRRPGYYSTAQLGEHRLKLADTLSTATFFSTVESAGRGGQPARIAQQRAVMRMSENLNLAAVIPFAPTHTIYAAAGLAAASVSLFALRHGVEQRLELRLGASHLPSRTLDVTGLQTVDLVKRRPEIHRRSSFDLLDIGFESLQDAARANTRDRNAQRKGADSVRSSGGTKADEHAEVESTYKSGNGGGQNSDEGAEQSPRHPWRAGANRATSSAGRESGLYSKLERDTWNLLARMKQSLSFRIAGRQATMSESAMQSGSNQNRSQNTASSQESPQDEQSADGQNSMGRADDQSAGQRSSDQPGSASGNREGAKDVKLAEQLAAMGKIGEIIGLRSAETTGDSTVESSSGVQQLSAPYSQEKTHHAGAWGEINRDEVPLLYQSYVQRYFEQVRRQRTLGPARARLKGVTR